MLPHSSRLTRGSFEKVFKSGKRKRLPFGQVLFVPASDFRAAVVIGKKVEPTAVGRNKLRRRLYAVFTTLRTEGLTGHYAFIATAPLARAPWKEASQEIQSVMRSFPV